MRNIGSFVVLVALAVFSASITACGQPTAPGRRQVLRVIPPVPMGPGSTTGVTVAVPGNGVVDMNFNWNPAAGGTLGVYVFGSELDQNACILRRDCARAIRSVTDPSRPKLFELGVSAGPLYVLLVHASGESDIVSNGEIGFIPAR